MRRILPVLALILLVISAGCIGGDSGGTTEQPKVYVTPCDVIPAGVQIRIVGTELDSKQIKAELMAHYVDDFTAPWAGDMLPTYAMGCYWGRKTGERREYYYCGGQYRAPQVTPSGVITRWLFKEFKIGFEVDEHEVGTWIDSAGKKHVEETFYYLTVRDVTGKCSVSAAPAAQKKKK